MRDRLQQNLDALRTRISEAALRAGRNPADVTLVAVTKYAELDWVRGLIELGVTDLGESRPQQLVQRAQLLPSSVRWHLIGHLQRNKVGPTLATGAIVHSVDSFRLLDRIERLAREMNVSPEVLLEVNVSGETAKNGFIPDELAAGWERCLSLQQTRVVGLMTMAPAAADPEHARPHFRNLRALRDEITERSTGRLHWPQLSMGMSGDFEPAVEEGATLVRIGSSLFEGLA